MFVVDFGVPDREDETVRQDTYVLEYMPKAIAAVRAATGRPDVSLVGYCMGGIFALLYTAAWADPAVRATGHNVRGMLTLWALGAL